MVTKEITKLFGFRSGTATKNANGDNIQLSVLDDRTDGTEVFIPRFNDSYVFPVNETLDISIAIEENIPVLIWGPHGSGKSTIAEQICNRTNRPSLRVQHSVDTERSDILGQWVLEGSSTVFHYGPLARAMKDGLVYIADEYDFALPNVLSAYQAVLEGEALVIPNAPAHLAVVKPHPDFRFVATGNTNGSGDETGLYQGTQLQNAANYSRFGVTVHMGYVADEKAILKKKFGDIPAVDLEQLMTFVGHVRKSYEDRVITNTISTRELLGVTNLAILRGREKLNFGYGLARGFANRMSSIDKAAITKIAERVFGAS